MSVHKVQFAVQTLLASTMWAVRSAILALYIRVFGSVVWLRRMAYSWIVIMVLFYALNIASSAFSLVPHKG